MKNIIFVGILFLSIILLAQNKVQDSEYLRITTEIENLKKEISSTKSDNPNLAQYYLRMGHLYSQINEVDKAQEAFENVIRIDPKNEHAYFMLGLIYEKKKMIPQAIDAWQKCLTYTQKPDIKKIAQKHLDYLRK